MNESKDIDSPVLVSSLDDMTDEHRSEINNSDLFALDCEGVDLGRQGKICLVQLSTLSTCFLFDVFGLDRDSDLVAFLKGVLENPHKTKVIHDCKMDADALFHQCGIQLRAVHDTQCWDIMIRGGTGSNLNQTLVAYGCTINSQRDHNLYRENPRFWATRPITEHMIDWASGDVMYLFDLYRAQVSFAAMAGPEMSELACRSSEDNASSLRNLLMQVCNVSYCIFRIINCHICTTCSVWL
jgi:ribonuclease D